MAFNRCIKNLLKFILALQNNSIKSVSYMDNNLNYILKHNCFNTRVVTLYNKLGKKLFIKFVIDGITNFSSCFRVCSVNDDCCTFLILNEVGDNFISTKQYITVNIDYICAIKCVQDVFISNL